MAEALDEIFLHGRAIALKDAERVGGLAAMEDDAADVGLVADLRERQVVLVDEARAFRAGCGADGDGLLLMRCIISTYFFN